MIHLIYYKLMITNESQEFITNSLIIFIRIQEVFASYICMSFDRLIVLLVLNFCVPSVPNMIPILAKSPRKKSNVTFCVCK